MNIERRFFLTNSIFMMTENSLNFALAYYLQ